MIIFDLDDTLIDTSGTVTPFKLRRCLLRLIEDGAKVDDFEQAYRQLMECNHGSFRSRDALAAFAAAIGAPRIEGALRELLSPLPHDFSLSTTPGAQEVLSFLGQKYPLALVTGGDPLFQHHKMQRAGLDSSLFRRVFIAEDFLKKPLYEKLAMQFSIEPHQVWVCGDRVDIDLTPAYELGFNTIHMQWGRGKVGRAPAWVRHSIGTLLELKGIFT